MFNLPLFLNDVGGSEILLIMMVVLMFFGSKSIPGIAKTLGKTLYEFRNATSELQNEIKKSGFDMKNDLKIENILKETTEPILQPMDQVFTDIENTVHYGATTQNSEIKPQDAAAEISENNVEENSDLTNKSNEDESAPDSAVIIEEPITTKTNEQ
ncbi:MAG: twin-arginine translocase TatA/TatE family subunit [Flavobacteriales bacterium]|nr:twin-arginine translocase TatA/TatE family subunit [Flavobacteriales bacterium]